MPDAYIKNMILEIHKWDVLVGKLKQLQDNMIRTELPDCAIG